jgi:F-type H+-transporting ATPase subunit gamma
VGAQLRVYRRRIRSVQSTKKITKAQELIAASRIAKAQARVHAARPYAEEISRALAELSGDTTVQHPMLTGVAHPERAGILLITSDRGLAGGYNANAIKAATELAARLEADGKAVDRYVIGRKGAAFYRFRRIPMVGGWSGFSEQPSFEHARPAAEAVVAALSATSQGEVEVDGSAAPGIDELWVIYTKFVNSVSQTPVAVRVAPVKGSDEQGSGGDDAAATGASYEFEPGAEDLIGALLPRYITSRIYSALLESAASESASRRQAMKSATDNASELIRTYTRLASQARQAEITQEISEIVGGADALAATGED